MFAINHAATALIIKRRYPQVSLVWLLLSVQLVEMLWVLFNFLGIERTATDAVVNSVRDIHLAHMPWSHSLASSVVLAILAWLLIGKIFKQRLAAVAIAAGVFSHIVLDLLTHIRDIPIAPFLPEPMLGSGLYAIPLAAFFFETAYGLFCWWVFRGGAGLLLVILAFNLANLSFFSVSLAGPETLLANRPLWIVGAVALQIAITLLLVGLLARPRSLMLEKATPP
jgi:hypothetical protein